MTLAAATTAAVLPLAAHAQKWSVESGVGAQLTWSSNPELGTTNAVSNDTVLDVKPHIAIRAEGARLKVVGTAALNAITSANGTVASRVLPEADITARLDAISRFLYIDAGARATQTSLNPFGARPVVTANTANTLTTGQLRFSPTIDSSIGSDTRYRLRSDNTWTRTSGGDAAVASTGEGYFARHAALIEHDPRPLGWRLEAERSQTRYRDSAEPDVTLDLARASVDYAFGHDITAGVHAGRERTSLLPNDPAHNIYGAQARWQPSPLTALTAFGEKRFFGKSWRAAFDHRTPLVAFNLSMTRNLDTGPQTLFELPAVDNVSALLDAMLTSRYPDPIERGRIVQDMLDRGINPQTLQPLGLFTRRVSVVTTHRAGVVLSGTRDTLALGAFRARSEDASQGVPAVTTDPLTNNVQYGASAELTHRLTPTFTVNVGADWSRITSILTPERSIQRSARLRITLQAAPRTTAFAGARYRDLDSNVATAGTERAAFIGLDHTF